jgi:ribosomal protein S18 acetylase RimI-like enzyme
VTRSRPYADGDLRLMLELIAELWPGGRHSVGYAFVAQQLPRDNWAARLWFDDEVLVGWGWRSDRWLSYEFRPGRRGLVEEMLSWAEPDATTVRRGDDETAELLRAHGFAHDPDAPWLRWNARTLERIDAPVVPPGYRLTTMADHGDFASRSAAHRSAFAPSRFTDEVYDTVRREVPWRADLDCVALAPDGSVAAYALAWLDDRNRVGELEPVGVRSEDQHRGLGRAVCLFALGRLREEGAETALVGSRGDDAYPIPRLLYESIGFRESWRNLVYRSASAAA